MKYNVKCGEKVLIANANLEKTLDFMQNVVFGMLLTTNNQTKAWDFAKKLVVFDENNKLFIDVAKNFYGSYELRYWS